MTSKCAQDISSNIDNNNNIPGNNGNRHHQHHHHHHHHHHDHHDRHDRHHHHHHHIIIITIIPTIIIQLSFILSIRIMCRWGTHANIYTRLFAHTCIHMMYTRQCRTGLKAIPRLGFKVCPSNLSIAQKSIELHLRRSRV